MTDHASKVVAAKVRLENAKAEQARQDDLVDCDEDCGAINEPRSTQEIWKAYEHWSSHPWLGGCSHGS